MEADPYFTPDGRSLYFISTRPVAGVERRSLDIWRADRNEATFARCRELLRRGEPLALFPEGTTHSHSMMLPLRTGAARIALSAEAEAGWQMGLQIVPVGLWYQNKTLFRSSVLVVIGEPFDLDQQATLYQADPHAAVDDLTERIDAQGAPECQFSELMLQRMAVAAERHGIAIRRLYSRTAIRSRAHMRGL